MITTSEIISFIILILIGVIFVLWIIDRICKCIEKCKSMKIMGKYIENASKSDLEEFLNDFNNAMKKGLGK